MVDEKLDEHVWVTVVATGYGDKRPAREERGREDRRPSLREPAGEPRVSRMRRDTRIDVDVPEFIPRF
jgi:cell division protein FtsZ